MHTDIHTCTHAHMHTYTHAHTHTLTHSHTHTHTDHLTLRHHQSRHEADSHTTGGAQDSQAADAGGKGKCRGKGCGQGVRGYGMYVAEALQKVRKVVLPVLPVVGFMLITGRGLHRAAWAAGRCTACRTLKVEEQINSSHLKSEVTLYYKAYFLFLQRNIPASDCTLCDGNLEIYLILL
jgi:hypothetical protein